MAYKKSYSKKSNGTKVDVYQETTDRILAMIETEGLFWQKPWFANSQEPKSMATKKNYRGINNFILKMVQHSNGYKSHLWGSFKFFKGLGYNVKKDEKATRICFFKFFEVDDKNDPEGKKKIRIPSMKFYSVFNLSQTDAPEEVQEGEKITLPHSPIEMADMIVRGYKNAPRFQDLETDRAYYSPTMDYINVPALENFKTPEGYYGTLFHEMIHSTGHESRLKRDMSGHFGSHDYSKEELIAEFGASFLQAKAGIFNDQELENSSAYIKGWSSKLRNDPKLFVKAVQGAQKAVDHILGQEYKEKQEQE